MAWTKEQQTAIDKRDTSVLLSAGAGSGKTAVLVEHLIQIICDEALAVPADKLLVVTFTKAAAGEMKKRLNDALRLKLKENPQSEFLQNQILRLNNANITTIHSYCLNLIKENFYLLDIEQNVRIGDDIEKALLELQVLDEVIEAYYNQNDENFRNVVEYYGGNDSDDDVKKLILDLYHQSMNTIQPKQWLLSLENKLKNTDWIELLQQYILNDIEKIISVIRKAKNICQISDYGLSKYEPIIHYTETQLTAAISLMKRDWDEFITFTDQTKVFDTLPRMTKKDNYDQDQKEVVSELYKEAKKLWDHILSKIANAATEQIAADIEELTPLYQTLSRITLDFADTFQKEKQKRNFIDFTDMEHLALQLLYDENLNPTLLSMELKQRYYQVLIDEYQDTNDLQEMIMQGVSRKDNYFMVGDTKQSIYGFRNANPKLFNEKYHTLPKSSIIDMNTNFRSRANILNGVNDVFSYLMDGTDTNPLYDERASLKCGNDFSDAIHPDEAIRVWELDNTADNLKINPKMTISSEGILIAQEIRKLISEKKEIYDNALKKYRPVTYKDIVILMRGVAGKGEEIYQELTSRGIPVYLDSGSGYFDAWEISVILDLLKVLDNPYQDLPLAAILKLPCFYYTEKEFLLIAKHKGEFLYEKLNNIKESEELYQKVQTTLEKINDWRISTNRLSLSSLIWYLYQEIGLYNYVLGLPEGEQRQANLKSFYYNAQKFETTGFKGLFMFLQFIDEMKKNNKNLTPPSLLSEDADVVRIMTIHHSKGLEFPIVFLANTGKEFNYTDINEDILINKELGLATYNADLTARIKYDTVFNEVIRYKMKEELLAEEKRILYVALTRAKEMLYLTGLNSGKSTPSYLNWILGLKEKNIRGKWQFSTIYQVEDAREKVRNALDENTKNILLAQKPFFVESESVQQINGFMQWQYPYRNDTKIPLKTTVSEINRECEIGLYKTPSGELRELLLKKSTTLTATQKGTLIHTIMRHIDLSQKVDIDYLRLLITELEEKSIILPDISDQIDLEYMVNFFESSFGERIQNATEVYREQPFTYALSSKVLNCNSDTDQSIVIQGMIDCLWREEDGLVLLDYKTDRVTPGYEKELAEQYKTQVLLYKKAVEDIWREKVKEVYLYFFATNTAISMAEIANTITFGSSDFEKDIV